MPVVAVTGHVELPLDVPELIACDLFEWTSAAVASGWQGITCLARGADQLFATAMTRAGGRYDVVLPASDYGSRLRAAGHAQPFRGLLNGAGRIDLMPFRRSSRAAYLAASEAMLERCDLLLAVYDGRPSRVPGDTADVVRRARDRQILVEILWPKPVDVRVQAAELALLSATSQRSTSS